MTEEQVQLVKDLISLARIEMQIRVIRAVADVLKLNDADELLTNTLFDTANTIEQALAEMASRPRRVLRAEVHRA